MSNNFPFATCCVLFPLIVASLSVLAYQQAQATATTTSCNVGRGYSDASSCRQICNTSFSTKGSAKWNLQR